MREEELSLIREELRRERGLTDVLLDTLPALVVVLDHEGRVVRFNRASEQASGYTFKELKGKEVWDILMFPEEKAQALEAFHQLASGKAPLAIQISWKTKSGARRLISWSASSLKDEKGRAELVIATGLDITDLLKSEVEQATLASIVANSDDAIIGESLEGVITSWNRGAEKLFGYSAAEAVGRSIKMVVPPDKPYEVDSFLDSIRRGERVQHYETERLCKCGRRMNVSLSLAPITDSIGRIVGISKIVRDITEQKKAEAAQRIGEARLNGIISSAMDAIITVNDEQRIVVFNAAAERMFGCPASEAIGSPLDRFIPKRFHASHRRHVEAYGRTGATSRTMGKLSVISGMRADGTEFPIEATISQVDIAGHKIYSAIVRDVTERYRAEQERAEMQSKILHQEKLAGIGLLASGMAHEIGNPLASIQAVCDNQLRKKTDPKVVEKFQRIRDQIARIVLIVRQLVNFARREPDVWKMVSVNDQIEAALMIAKLSRQSKTAEVKLELDPTLPQTVCVGDQLSQVFLNLFLNSFDAMHDEGGRIVVRSYMPEPGRIAVSVEDNGIGISEQNLSNLFVPFFTTKEVGKGTGLGLHVSQGIVRRHGGEISVKSQANLGATFTVELPVRERPPEKI